MLWMHKKNKFQSVKVLWISAFIPWHTVRRILSGQILHRVTSGNFFILRFRIFSCKMWWAKQQIEYRISIKNWNFAIALCRLCISPQVAHVSPMAVVYNNVQTARLIIQLINTRKTFDSQTCNNWLSHYVSEYYQVTFSDEILIEI